MVQIGFRELRRQILITESFQQCEFELPPKIKSWTSLKSFEAGAAYQVGGIVQQRSRGRRMSQADSNSQARATSMKRRVNLSEPKTSKEFSEEPGGCADLSARRFHVAPTVSRGD
jgi:hypothetical protein